MIEVWVYAIVSVIIVSLVSFVGVFTLLLGIKNTDKLLLFLISVSAGTLFGGAFLHLLPEAVEKNGFTAEVSLLVLLGVFLFFVLEKFVHFRHGRKHPTEMHKQVHSHAYQLAPINLMGDALHNLLDGLVIAASYLISIPAGIATTIAVVFHEVPQEIADFGVLIYSGMKKGKALLMNFLSAAFAIVGTIVGLAMGSNGEKFIPFIIPVVAGGFIYIAGSNLIPQLHREQSLKKSLLQIFGLIAGVGLMYAMLFFK